MNVHDIGDRVRISVEFVDEDGDLSDPVAVTFVVSRDSEPSTAFVFGTDAELVKDAVGEYHVMLDPEEAGYWHYRWEGTETPQTAEEGKFRVRRRRVPAVVVE